MFIVSGAFREFCTNITLVGIPIAVLSAIRYTAVFGFIRGKFIYLSSIPIAIKYVYLFSFFLSRKLLNNRGYYPDDNVLILICVCGFFCSQTELVTRT